ncbi:MAG: hypothetical protein WC847_02745 [Candidatus Paceibacterota bacterium]|jgi:hypothetical protein
MEKIKQFIESDTGKDIMIVIIVILVGLGSFELGRLSKGTNSEGLKVIYPAVGDKQAANVIEAVPNKEIPASNNSGKTFFASSRGTKYYTTSCSAGKTIKQENRVYFTTGEEAVQAGYVLSSACN